MGDLLKKILVVGAAILRGNLCLVAQRSGSMNEPLRWEFPGGKVERDESGPQALIREVREELDCLIRPGAMLGSATVVEPDRELRLVVYAAEIESGTPRAQEHREIRWADAPTMRSLDWAPADLPILPRVLSALSEPDGRRTEEP